MTYYVRRLLEQISGYFRIIWCVWFCATITVTTARLICATKTVTTARLICAAKAVTTARCFCTAKTVTTARLTLRNKNRYINASMSVDKFRVMWFCAAKTVTLPVYHDNS